MACISGEEALAPLTEAVKLRRELAETNPAAWNPTLAMALNNLSNRLAEAGHKDQALAPITEATDLYRELAATNPAAWNPNLAMALKNLSTNLTEVGRHKEALAVQDEMPG
ncbi:tetratricopeptide repeat protein [Arthrobacter sp. UYEF20]|uniref:tetratricopeptide repeat protein n=1 Tax=Arthrobacter sp. UYEF20 TaxID=1756363 RepID=UPI003394CDC5